MKQNIITSLSSCVTLVPAMASPAKEYFIEFSKNEECDGSPYSEGGL